MIKEASTDSCALDGPERAHPQQGQCQMARETDATLLKNNIFTGTRPNQLP